MFYAILYDFNFNWVRIIRFESMEYIGRMEYYGCMLIGIYDTPIIENILVKMVIKIKYNIDENSLKLDNDSDYNINFVNCVRL